MKIVKLTESDLTRLVKKVIEEQGWGWDEEDKHTPKEEQERQRRARIVYGCTAVKEGPTGSMSKWAWDVYSGMEELSKKYPFLSEITTQTEFFDKRKVNKSNILASLKKLSPQESANTQKALNCIYKFVGI